MSLIETFLNETESLRQLVFKENPEILIRYPHLNELSFMPTMVFYGDFYTRLITVILTRMREVYRGSKRLRRVEDLRRRVAQILAVLTLRSHAGHLWFLCSEQREWWAHLEQTGIFEQQEVLKSRILYRRGLDVLRNVSTDPSTSDLFNRLERAVVSLEGLARKGVIS